MGTVNIRLGDAIEPVAQELLGASHALMQSMFPSTANHFLSIEELRAQHIKFWLAETDSETVGCAALATQQDYGEVKSMFVAPAGRGKGVAAKLLENLIAQARADDLACLRLETGTGLDAAHRLYERYNFVDREAFGTYVVDAPYSRYMELAL
ncbi:MAG: putative acetyltransferase [Ascidiaceihabitans sp.]|jgi:putative acetyltransferase